MKNKIKSKNISDKFREVIEGYIYDEYRVKVNDKTFYKGVGIEAIGAHGFRGEDLFKSQQRAITKLDNNKIQVGDMVQVYRYEPNPSRMSGKWIECGSGKAY